MKLRSAFDDFMRGTLAALPSVWQKIDFLGTLRTDAGRYEHWGMEHVYGERAAQDAIAKAHSEVFTEILSTPIQQLLAEASQVEAEQGGTFLSHCNQERRNPRLIPEDPGGGEGRHLAFILRTLSLLARSRAKSSSSKQSDLRIA